MVQGHSRCKGACSRCGQHTAGGTQRASMAPAGYACEGTVDNGCTASVWHEGVVARGRACSPQTRLDLGLLTCATPSSSTVTLGKLELEAGLDTTYVSAYWQGPVAQSTHTTYTPPALRNMGSVSVTATTRPP